MHSLEATKSHCDGKDIKEKVEDTRPASVIYIEGLDLPPGESLLVDDARKVNNAHVDRHGIVLTPFPSNHPDDPLNWSEARRWATLFFMCVWVFVIGGATTSASLTYEGLLAEFDTTIGFLNNASAGLVFIMGFLNVLTNPIADRFGRRPVYLASCFLTSCSLVLCAACPNASAWSAGRVLMGVTAAPSEQLPARTISDLFFLHRRGLGISTYIFSAAAGAFICPVPAGFVMNALGWRWIYGIFAIIMFANFLGMCIFLEETCFDRESHPPAVLDPEGNRQLLPITGDFWRLKKLYINGAPQSIKTIIAPFKLLQFPIVLWSALNWGIAQTWLMVISLSLFIIFQSPTYDFRTEQTGLTMLAPMIGSCLGMWLGGAGADRFLLWRARRSNGIMKAESRLFPNFIAGPLFSAGLILYGVGAYHGIHWMGPVCGMALVGVALPINAETSLSYAIEAYPGLAGSVSVIVVLLRNVIVGALIWALDPWITNTGLQMAFISAGIIALVVALSCIIIIMFGSKLRSQSAAKYYKYVRQLGSTQSSRPSPPA